MSFIQLHNHTTKGSLLDGMGLPEQYAQRASELGMPGIGVSDHGTIDSFFELQKACKKYDIVPLFGIEWYIVPDIKQKIKGEKRSHILTFAKNETGYRNICKMISISNIEGMFYRPRISPEILLNNSEGLIFLTGCSATSLFHVWGQELFDNLYDKHPDSIYCELMAHTHKEQYEANEITINFANKHNLPCVCTNDSHYVMKSDYKAHEILLAIGSNKKISDPTRWKFDGEDFYLRDRREMLHAFMNQNQLERDVVMKAMSNTIRVMEQCSDFRWIEKREPSLPKIKIIGEQNETEFFEKLCRDNFDKSQFKDKQIYKERLEEELRLIKIKKYERYFLIVWDVIRWCKEQGIIISPGRGSSAGSLVAHLLGITGVDPIKYKLLFSRFISESRISDPDIDQDVPHIHRARVKEYLKKTYGENNVAGISTFSTLKGKQAMRDVCRVFEIPLAETNRVCSVIESKLEGADGYGHTIEQAIEQYEEGQKFKEKYPEVVDIAIALENQNRNRGTHAAGIVISAADLRDGNCPLIFDKNKELVVSFDKEDAEYAGYMKLDLLGLKMLSVLDYCRKLIKENHKIDIDFNSLEFNDKKCFEEISKGNGIGIFQFGSINMRKFCKQLKIDSFETLAAASALWRPGPLGSGAVDSYIKRKNGEEEVPQQHPIINEITKDTYGVMIYQETAMQLVNRLAGFSWEEADQIRKIMAKSKGQEALRQYEEKFVDGCLKERTLREEQARNLWNDIVSFGSYLFNKSHAIVYSVLSYWDLYCKVYYPVEYMVSLLTYGTDDDNQRDEYIEEIFRLGIEIRPPKVGISKANEYKIHENKIYLPFSSIKGVGNKTAQGFEKLDKSNNKGFYKKETSPVSTRFLNILEKINAWEDKPLTDEESDNISQYLGVSLVKNKLYRYKNLMKLLDSSLKLSKVKEININEIDAEYRYYFGYIQELNLTTKNGKNGKYNIATASFKDSTGDCKISFDSTLYQNCSSEVEHCEGEIIILKASCPKKAGNLVVAEAWFQQQILQGELDTLFLGLAEGRRYKSLGSQNCNACDLRKDCNKISETQQGRYNMMIINETALSGEAERVLWREMRRHDFVQKDFHVSSFIKCEVKDLKRITRKHVDECSKWLEEEIENLRPFVILSFGNTGIKFFTDEDSGIMTKNGTTEWNERYGCWVCYCNSPTTTFYGQDNMKTFKEGCENFIKKVKKLGLITF